MTLEDWYFFGHELPVRLEMAVKEVMVRADLPIDWLEEMPYSIMSVDEFETATGVINTIGIHPFISGKVLDPQRRHWSYGLTAMIGTRTRCAIFPHSLRASTRRCSRVWWHSPQRAAPRMSSHAWRGRDPSSYGRISRGATLPLGSVLKATQRRSKLTVGCVLCPHAGGRLSFHVVESTRRPRNPISA